jgi:dihydroorotase
MSTSEDHMPRSTRRAFLGTLGAAAAAVPAFRSAAGAQPAASYDLLIKGGRVIDAAQKLNGQLDVAISNGKIATVAANIPANRAREVFDATGKLVTAGLINTHAHLYRYAYPISVDPEAVGLPAGVTTAIDAGSGGASTFLGFRKYVIEKQPLRIYAMLNISTIGNFGNELYLGLGNINAKAAIRVINEHKDRILAIKVRINGNPKEVEHDAEVLTRARSAADETGLPLMVHWTNEPKLLAILKRGDILTHPFNIPTPNQSNLFGGEPGKILPQILELKDRGIWTESQAVNSHHLWVNSEAAFAQGWAPDLISTDMGAITPATPNGLMLPWTMTQYLHLGLTIEQVIERVTQAPTRVFKFPERHGTLETGVTADVTVIDLQEGNFELIDQQNNKRTAKRKIVPVATVHGGTLMKIDPRVHEAVPHAGVRV